MVPSFLLQLLHQHQLPQLLHQHQLLQHLLPLQQRPQPRK